MKCFLHIGTEKTATTTLQSFFDLNRNNLYKFGFIYTKSAGATNNRSLSAAAYDLDRRDDFTKLNNIHSNKVFKEFQKRVIYDLKNELSTKTGSTIVFSSEHFQSRLTNISEIVRLKEILFELGINDVSIVIYLRNPAEIANSLYSTDIKAGGITKSPPPPNDKYYGNICNHRITLEKFKSVFGEKAITPRIFHICEFKNGSIIDDFLEIIGAPVYKNYVIPPNKNESLSSTGLEILRRFNQKVPTFIKDKLNPLRHNIVEYFDVHFGNDKYVMSHELHKQYDTEFKHSNEWVRKNYFPEKHSLFPQMTYYKESKVDIPLDQINRIVNMLVNIWIDKNKRILDLSG